MLLLNLGEALVGPVRGAVIPAAPAAAASSFTTL